MHRLCLVATLLIILGVCSYRSEGAEQNEVWPQFRGLQSLGISENPRLPDHWNADEGVAWSAEIPGHGWSCPIVWKDRVFVTTVTAEGDDAAEKKRGIYFGGDRHEAPQTTHEWRLVCLSLADGRVLWNQLAHRGVPPQSIHLKNTYASETPATDGQRVYAYFGNLGVFCFTMSGELQWSRMTGSFKTADGMGTAGSPILHENRLYVLHDNEEQSFLLALDTVSGHEVWRVARSEKTSWSTPFLWSHAARTELVVSGSGVARSYDLDGRELWQLGDMTLHSIPTPVTGSGLLYLCSGHVLGKTRPIVAVRPGAAGDITLAADQSSNDFVAWSMRKAAPYNPSPLWYRDQLYVVTDLGLLAAYDAQTGRAHYEKKRLPNARAITASPWAYNGNVFCLNEYGDTFVVRAGPEFELLRVNSLGEDEMCMATPAVGGDTLLVRSDRRLYAIRRSSSAPAGSN